MKDGLKRVEYSAGKGFVSPIEEVIEDFRNGRMIILVDAEDRENEGDLVIPAQMATPEAINFPYLLAVIEDSGHMTTMEQPEAVSAMLRDWLQRPHAGSI